MTKPILFYSKKDQASINLWNKLMTSNSLELFIKICVDNNPKIPKIVTTVPAIYVKNRPLLTGTAIQMYLNTLQNTFSSHTSRPNNITPVQNTPNHSANSTPPSAPPSAPPSNTGGKESDSALSDFNPVEMSNRWSDSYAFIDDNAAPLSFSFQFLNNDPATVSTNGEQPGPVKQEYQSKRASNDFQSRLEKMQQDRSSFK